MLLAHGFGEHAGRYARLAESLNSLGFALQAVDHRGHGRSGGERALVPASNTVASDFLAFAESVRAEQPGLPLVLYGHSMGGVVAAQAALASPAWFNGLILSSPFLYPDRPAPAALRSGLKLLARVMPRLGVEKIPAEHLSRIPAEVTAYRTDPLVHQGSVPARTASSLLQAGSAVLAQAAGLTQPLLIVHGEADRIAGVEGSRQLHAAAGAQDRTLHVVPAGRHELLNDTVQDEFLQLITGWLASRFPPEH